MRRFHVHLGVPDLAASIRFYSGMFGMPPTVEKSDYAKWMLDDPRVNFAISHRSQRVGLNHLGLQAETADELAGIRDQFAAADSSSLVDEPNVNCCYARGNKHWTTDPQGIAWEAFHTLEDVPLYSGPSEATQEPASACGTTATSCGTQGTDCCAPSAEKGMASTKARCCA
jgi:catechol 2,3-dioxygenase-like lactoylglutathione lyase family enzyme